MQEDKITWDESRAISERLIAEAEPFSAQIEEGFATKDGLYCLIYEGSELSAPWSEPKALVLYVGRLSAHSIRHFRDDTAVSTVRRSLAAMLAHAYDLHPVANSSDPDDTDRFTNYKLTPDSESKLSQWMKDHLRVAFYYPEDASIIDQVYLGLLDYSTPMFNFQKNPNNYYGAQVKSYRLQMAELAAVEEEKQLTQGE